jgi:hypothetical protein
MSVKRIILYVIIFLVVIAATVATLYLLNVRTSETYSRGVLPADDYVFQEIDGVAGVPAFAQLPAERQGWKKVTSSSEATYAHVQFARDNTCKLDITSQLLPNTETTKNDFLLSRSLVETTARTVDGVPSEPYVISAESNKGNVELYSALYSPKLALVSSTGTTPTNEGGSKALDGDFTTYVAARVFGSDVAIGQSTAESTLSSGIISIGAMLPAVVVSYTCSTPQFDVNDALGLLGEIAFDLTSAAPVTSATSGK